MRSISNSRFIYSSTRFHPLPQVRSAWGAEPGRTQGVVSSLPQGAPGGWQAINRNNVMRQVIIGMYLSMRWGWSERTVKKTRRKNVKAVSPKDICGGPWRKREAFTKRTRGKGHERHGASKANILLSPNQWFSVCGFSDHLYQFNLE